MKAVAFLLLLTAAFSIAAPLSSISLRAPQDGPESAGVPTPGVPPNTIDATRKVTDSIHVDVSSPFGAAQRDLDH